MEYLIFFTVVFALLLSSCEGLQVISQQASSDVAESFFSYNHRASGDFRRGLKAEPVEPTCPFIADQYLVAIETVRFGTYFLVYDPSDYGLDEGFYCQLKNKESGADEGTNATCTCGTAYFCDTDYATITVTVRDTSIEYIVGRCTIETWVIAVPVAFGILVCLCCCIGCWYNESRGSEKESGVAYALPDKNTAIIVTQSDEIKL